ncbi:Uncharacterised protein [Candidatus Norongarragalina meridionalis]|nr:Uncharacterised protein [Candidatus Norongarragalina meridionalis]
MKERRVTVKMLGEAKEEYRRLREISEEERKKGTTDSFHQTLLRSIDAKIELLKADYGYGIQIPKRCIPAKYVREYGATNLWKADLAGYWRMIYTLKQPLRGPAEIGIIDVWLDVLGIMDHEKYDKLFGYRGK